jgi:hypothetical protein
MAFDFDFFDLPNPRERGFVIVAEEKPSDHPLPDWLDLDAPVLYSALEASADYKWITHGSTVAGDLRGYRLIHAAKAGKMKRAFYFCPSRRDEQREAAIGKERWIKRPFYWPTVLLKLQFEKGNLPLSAINAAGEIMDGARVHPQSRSRPGNQYPTWFRIRRFWSDEPFEKNDMHLLPTTDSISWAFDGSSGSFPECLHPGCHFPMINTSGEIIPNAGTIDTDEVADMDVREYPPTPMTDWEPYVLEDTRKEIIEGGLAEERILVEAFPPIDDREIST